MAYFKTDLPLFNEPDYIYQVALQDDSYSLRFTYNETMKLYTMSIYDVNQNPLCCGVGLAPNYPIILNYVIDDLTGCFLMVTKASVDTEFYKLYPDKLATYYTLSYIYDEAV